MTRFNSFVGVRNDNGVKEENLRKFVPSIFATEAHESRSDRYEFIPTWDVLTALQDEGFKIVSAQQSRTRDVGKREYTKHLLRLRHTSELGKVQRVGDTIFEVLLKNSHDGSSRYELMGGLFRLVCSNGMVVGDHLLEPVKVMHTGRVRDEVIDASYTVIEQAPKVVEYVEKWKRLALTSEEQTRFATDAARLRFNKEDGESLPVSCAQLLHPRRPDDTGRDLWSVFNRVQENCIKGGMQGLSRNSRGANVRRSIRSVTGIDQDLKLNKGLWTLAEELYVEKVLA